jgi:hypothetical protein
VFSLFYVVGTSGTQQQQQQNLRSSCGLSSKAVEPLPGFGKSGYRVGSGENAAAAGAGRSGGGRSRKVPNADDDGQSDSESSDDDVARLQSGDAEYDGDSENGNTQKHKSSDSSDSENDDIDGTESGSQRPSDIPASVASPEGGVANERSETQQREQGQNIEQAGSGGQGHGGEGVGESGTAAAGGGAASAGGAAAGGDIDADQQALRAAFDASVLRAEGEVSAAIVVDDGNQDEALRAAFDASTRQAEEELQRKASLEAVGSSSARGMSTTLWCPTKFVVCCVTYVWFLRLERYS